MLNPASHELSPDTVVLKSELPQLNMTLRDLMHSTAGEIYPEMTEALGLLDTAFEKGVNSICNIIRNAIEPLRDLAVKQTGRALENLNSLFGNFMTSISGFIDHNYCRQRKDDCQTTIVSNMQEFFGSTIGLMFAGTAREAFNKNKLQ